VQKYPRWWMAAIMRNGEIMISPQLMADFGVILHGDSFWPEPKEALGYAF